MSVAIVMGSDSDLSAMQGAIDILNRFGVDHIVRCVSAHRGMIASATELPVIGVPVRRPAFDGLDALLSIVQMPAGIPVATMAVDGSANAALFAVRILARSDEGLRTQLRNYAAELIDVVAEKDAHLRAQPGRE